MKRKELIACYIRVSSQDQKLHGYSVAAQRDKLTTYAEDHNMIIFDWYVDEGVSGRKLIKNRPELQRMICDAEQKKFERIIFIKLDRFFRSVGEYHEAMKRIGGVQWSATEENYDTTTSSGRFFITSKLAVAEMEADQTGERIRLVNEYKVKNGQPLSGTLCFGFVPIGERGKKKVIHDPEREQIVNEAIQVFLLHQSMRKVASYVNSHYGMTWNQRNVKWLLSNPMLYGSYRGNDNYCEPYITKAEWDKIQTMLIRGTKYNSKRVYIFSGLFICPQCGRRLTAFWNSGGGTPGNRMRYSRYKCKFHYENGLCPWKRTVSENVMERYLLSVIEDEVQNQVSKQYDIMPIESTVNPSDIKAKIDRLNYAWENGRITIEEYDTKYAELDKQLHPDVPVQDFSHIEKILQSDWKDKYAALDQEHQKLFWKGIIKEIHLNEDASVKDIIFL